MKFSTAATFVLSFAASYMMADASDSRQAFTGTYSEGPCNLLEDKGEKCAHNSEYSLKTHNYCQTENYVFQLEDGSFKQSTWYIRCCSDDYYLNGGEAAMITCPAYLPTESDTCEEATGSACTAHTKALASCEYGDVSCYCDGGKWICN